MAQYPTFEVGNKSPSSKEKKKLLEEFSHYLSELTKLVDKIKENQGNSTWLLSMNINSLRKRMYFINGGIEVQLMLLEGAYRNGK